MSTVPPPLTELTIQPAMQTLTAVALGLIPNASASIPQSVFNTVRIAWQPQGQPAATPTSEIVTLRCEIDDVPSVNRVRDLQTIPNPNDTNDPPQTLLQQWTYMRVWRTYWEFQGPQTSCDRARALHSALFTQAVHDTFAALNLALYWVTDPASPRRVYYLSDGRWWTRWDFEAQFNELVTEQTVIPIIESVEVKAFENSAGQILDFTANLQPTGLGTGNSGTLGGGGLGQ